MTTTVVVDGDEVRRLMAEVSVFGATPAGGLHRLTASRADGEARAWLRAYLTENGFRVLVDAVGNMFGILDLAGPDAPLVLAGSHLDSQPFGGRFDGAYGVVAAAVAVRAAGDAAKDGGRHTCNLGVVNWTNEEGARFAPSLLGSNVFAGKLDAAVGLAARDAAGVTLGEALAEIGFAGTDAAPGNVTHYLEVHIEQGPNLEKAGKRIGVVEGNWGTVKFEAEFVGKAAHTGPTPMAERRDALLPAAELITFVRRLSDETGGALLSSIGRLDVSPNSTNVVPERVRVFVELRDADGERLAAARFRLEEKIVALAQSGIKCELRCVVDRPAGSFNAMLADVIDAAAADCGYPSMRLRTVAGHDAVALSSVLPSAMLFVPSVAGISHNEAEFTRDDDLVAGAEVLAGSLARLAGLQ
ncbi:MAG: Zn-dependent hydrolase [Proteobacteria bacterium]|nr:Zn-dependent hydrolase [Pseudomonadota bacterium]